jgi:hypothetical protein
MKSKVLFHFETEECWDIFSQQISQINDRSEILKITQVLNNARVYTTWFDFLGIQLLEQLDL